MTKTLKTVTLGCKVNQYETEFVRQGFERLGYRKAVEGEPVDLCIVNTCTVTAESEAKSRKIIRRLAKAHPQAEIIVMGCFATRAPEEAAALPGVVEVIADKRRSAQAAGAAGIGGCSHAASRRFDGRRRALVKVQDGCRMKCSYCIVPTVRPHLMSRPVDEVLDEVRRLLADGHREIVLTGIHLGDYGKDEERRGGEGERRRRGDSPIRPFGLPISSVSPSPPLPLSPLLSRFASAPNRRPRRRFPRPAVEHRGGRGHAGVDRADGRAPRADLPSPASAAAKRLGRGAAADEPPLDGRAVHRALPRDSGRARSAGPDDRRHRRFSGRDGGGFCGHVPGGRRSGIRQGPRLPVQPAARHARRRHARPSAGPDRHAASGETGKAGQDIADAVFSGTSGPPFAGVGRRCRFPAGPAGWAAPPTTMPRLPCPAGGSCSAVSLLLVGQRVENGWIWGDV